MLKDHPEFALPEQTQLLALEGGHVHAVQEHLPGGGFDETVDAAHQGRFAAP